MGGCQNYGPFWGTLNIWCRIIIGTQKGTIILTTTHSMTDQMRPLAEAPARSIERGRDFSVSVLKAYSLGVGK